MMCRDCRNLKKQGAGYTCPYAADEYYYGDINEMPSFVLRCRAYRRLDGHALKTLNYKTRRREENGK